MVLFNICTVELRGICYREAAMKTAVVSSPFLSILISVVCIFIGGSRVLLLRLMLVVAKPFLCFQHHMFYCIHSLSLYE